MRASFQRLTLLFLIIGLVSGSSVVGTTLEHFSLGQMVHRAAKIFRGTVLDAVPGTVQAGGGEIPTITYTILVDEAFKGTFEEVKGQRITKIQMLGKLPPRQVGDVVRYSPLPDLPILNAGSDYLLFATAPSAIGLSTTLGLAQGRFELLKKTEDDIQAVNGFNNLGLFKSTRTESFAIGGPQLPVSGPVSYSLLADRIQAELAH